MFTVNGEGGALGCFYGFLVNDVKATAGYLNRLNYLIVRNSPFRLQKVA
jgi:hypothetical protein